MSVLSRRIIAYTLSFLLLPLSLVGCGGGNEPIQLPGQTAPQMGDHENVTLVRGVVTSAHPNSNTIMVGDDEVVISDATVSQNGVVTPDARPKVGQTVSLSVTRDAESGRFVAQAIDVNIVLRGPVGIVNSGLSTFAMLGQTVSYSTSAVFGFPTGTTLSENMLVSVSGSISGTGRVTATRVDYISAAYTAGNQIQVAGIVEGLNTGVKTFSLGSLNVNYTAAPSAPSLANTMTVYVGANTLPVNNTLNVTELSTGTAAITNNIDMNVAVRGPIESIIAGGTTFNVMGQTVTFNSNTVFPNGQAATLLQNYVVKVLPAASTIAGQLLAARIELVSSSYQSNTPAQVSGVVQNVNTTGATRTFTIGSLTVNYANITGLTFTPTAGMAVVVAATTLPTSSILTATELRQGTITTTNPGTPVSNIDLTTSVKGPIDQVNIIGTGTGTFTVLGQTIAFNTSTLYPNSTQANTLVNGYVVKVRLAANAVAGQLTASQVELVGTSYVTGAPVQVSGVIQNLNNLGATRTFSLGSLTVNYTTLTTLNFVPANGMSVTVAALSLPVSSVLTATEMVQTAANPGGSGATIDTTASIKGPVDLVTASTFTLLGQTVTFNTATQFVNTTGTTFIMTAGNVVKVVTAASSTPGQLVALRVELVSLTYLTGTSVQLTGIVQGLNTGTRTFTVAGSAMTVNYTGVTNPTFTPTEGATVIVASTTLPVGNVFNATAMALGAGTLPGTLPQPTTAIVTGTISAVISTTSFNLTGVTVRTTPTTQFANGSPAMLIPGINVMVTGILSGGLPNAILDATMIRFSGTPIAGASRIQIRGPLEWIDPLNRRLSVLGVTVTLPPSSIFVGDDEPDHSIDLADLRPGQVVTVAGVGTNKQLNATFLALARNGGRPRDSDEDDEFQSRLPTVGMPLTGGLPGVNATGVRAWLWAPLEAVQAPMMSAFGIPVVTTTETAFFPEGHRTRASSPTVFFGSATVGRTLRVEGVYVNGTFIAQRVCIVNSLRGSDFSDGRGNRDD